MTEKTESDKMVEGVISPEDISAMGSNDIRATLIEMLHRISKERYLPTSPVEDLTSAEARVVGIIYFLQDAFEEVRPSTLTALTKMTGGSLTQTIDSLIRKGVVERKHRSEDFRAVYLMLTPYGISLANAIRSAHDERYDEMIRYLGDEDARTLVRIFGKVIQYNEELAQEGKAVKVLDNPEVDEIIDEQDAEQQ